MAAMAVMSQAEGRVGGARLCAPPSSLHILPLLFTMTILTLPIYDHYFALYQIYVLPTYIPNKMHPSPLQVEGTYIHPGDALGGGRKVKTAQVTGEVGNGRADFHLTKAVNLHPCGHKLWLMLVLMLELVEQRDGSVSKRGREGGRRGRAAVQCSAET